MPKYQDAEVKALEHGFHLYLTCFKCGQELLYNRAKGKVEAVDEVIDSTSVFAARGVDPIENKLRKAKQLDSERNFREALSLLEECEVEARRKDNQRLLQAILQDQAAALADMGQIAKASQRLGEQRAICERMGDEKALGPVLVNQGILMIRGLGKPEEGVLVLAEGLRKCNKAGLTKTVAQGLAVFKQAAVEILKTLSGNTSAYRGDVFEETVRCLQDYAGEFGETNLASAASRALFILQTNKM